MKKILTLIAVAFASITVANAQIGIFAGIGSSTTAKVDTEDYASNLSNVSNYHVGAAIKVPLPFGLAFQPELLYQMKGGNLGDIVNDENATAESAASTLETKNGFAELGLGLQWGLDLVAFRPFVFGKPFIGYQITEDEDVANALSEDSQAFLEQAKNKLEYGFAVGFGIDLLEHFQLSFEMFKNLGKLYNAEGEINAKAEDIDTSKLTDAENYGGFKVTLGFFF